MKQKIANIASAEQFEKPVYSASLAVFRVVFGFMLFFSTVRFWLKGWIEELYINPKMFFTYWGFEWVHPLGQYTYLLFIVCGISALFFALGLYYRIASILLFLSFTYIELMDKTNYLNHYYFVTLVLFLMMWLPANVNFSLDAMRKPQISKRFVPLWTVGSIRMMMSIVYVYAGLAKLNSDWLIEAMPLRLWLPANNDMPLLGPLFNHLWVAYFFSWFGALYDLTIPFFLLNRKTRQYAYATVVVFHLLTAALFPIGVFPYVMIVSALVFFDSKDADKFVQRMKEFWPFLHADDDKDMFGYKPKRAKLLRSMFVLFFTIQIIMPWRYLLNKGELFWTEDGYRFSWRVMLMEKMGYAQFIVKDAATGNKITVNNNEFLTRNQERMMATQPDFILQYAHYLHDEFTTRGVHNPEVYATIYVAMNGRRSRLYADTTVDLAKETDTWRPKKWILDFDDKIHGL
ncbi:MAG: HTTM domain-containing protein [Chitinophagales bacterium]|nr:HTTM domain-containing protein [Chitinophagales bacterium]